MNNGVEEKSVESPKTPCADAQITNVVCKTPVSPAYVSDGEILHQNDENPLLNYDALVEACSKIFRNGTSISQRQYQSMIAESYKINMEEYCKLHNFSDAIELADFFSQLTASIPKNTRTNRILVVGCGQGRLAEVYITLANRFGVKEIIQNDLVKSHVEQTREKIRKIYGNDGSCADGVKITYVPGSIQEASIPGGDVDAAYMLWFVSAEFCNPKSDNAMGDARSRTYKKIYKLLKYGGGMVEDSPDQNCEPGFFYTAARKTAHILIERGILPKQAKNLILSNYRSEQSDGFPYLLRYVPRNGADNVEKQNAGLTYVTSVATSIPVSSKFPSAAVVVQTLQDFQNTEEAIHELRSIQQRTVTFPSKADPLRKPRVYKLWKKK
jgi:SAM-dependent methyltransferase